MFYNDFSSVFAGVFASASDTCFKCFIFFQTYVTNVLSECFKSRSTIANVAMTHPATELRLLPRAARLALSLPSPALHLVTAVRARGNLPDTPADAGGGGGLGWADGSTMPASSARYARETE